MTTKTAEISVYDIYGTSTPDFDQDYIATERFAIPYSNDTFLSPKGEVCTLQDGDVRPSGPRLMLRRKSVFDVYGTYFPSIPEGWSGSGEFRKGKAGEYVLGPTYKQAILFRGSTLKSTVPRIILKKPEEVYGKKVITAPEGYTLGKFTRPVASKKYLSDVLLVVDGSIYASYSDMCRYELIPVPPAPKFKVGDRVACLSCPEATPGVVTQVNEDKTYKVNFTGLTRYGKNPFGLRTEKEENLSILASTTTRWLIEVESSVKPESIQVIASRHGGWHNVNFPILSVTPKP